MYSNRILPIVLVVAGVISYSLRDAKLMVIVLIPASLFLIWIAMRALWVGATFGRTTSRVYTREQQPGWFYTHCLSRLAFGVLGLFAGVALLPRVFG